MNHPVEIFRFCPCCGSTGFLPSGNRSLKCADCGFHFYVNSAAAVAALIFNRDGKLLVTRRAVEPDIGKIDLPGGFVDPGETAEAALTRELREELGITSVRLTYLTSGTNEYLFTGMIVFTTDLLFKAEIGPGIRLTASDDISSFEWVDPEQVAPEDIPAPSIRRFIKEIAPRERNHSQPD